MAGKGDKPRLRQVPRKQYEENWDRIFGKKEEKPKEEPKEQEKSDNLEYKI